MIAAIDAMGSPPKTAREFDEIIRYWQEQEIGRHARSTDERIAISAINRAEIESIVKTKKFRIAHADKDDARQRNVEFRGHVVGNISIFGKGAKAFGIRSRTFKAWGFERFRSCDLFLEEDNSYIRFVFYEDETGRFKTTRNRGSKSFTVRGNRLIRHLGLRNGIYIITPMNPEKTEFGLDVENL